MDRWLEVVELEAWEAERARADDRARGSRAGPATIAGQVAGGLVLAESSVEYGATYEVSEDGLLTVTVSIPFGYGVGGYGTSFSYS